MTPDDWQRVQETFDRALALAGEDRVRFLDSACASRADLRTEVETLLRAHDAVPLAVDQPVLLIAPELLADPVDPSDAASSPHQQREGLEEASRTIGPYIVLRELGRGGMGVVYLADDTRLARRVALKAIAPGLSATARARERLRHEARAAAALMHPGIATVYVLEEIDGELYLATEYVPGETLRQRLDAGTLPRPEAIRIARQLAVALAEAHAAGIVHRDLKPENIVLTPDDRTKILDFGIARREGLSVTRLTEDGALIGTPAYMAPEQIRAEQADRRADVFAFGVILYEMLTGVHPFAGDTLAATAARILEYDPPDPLLPDSSPDAAALNTIVSTCLSKVADGRFHSTRDLAAALQAIGTSAGSVVAARPVADANPAERNTARWWWGFHQAAASLVYVAMLVPAWSLRKAWPAPWGTTAFLVLLTAVVVAVTVRLHLWFSARVYERELEQQRSRARGWMHTADAAFSGVLAAGALAVAGDRGGLAALLLAVAAASAVAAFLIEPATTRAAFRRREEP